MLVDMVQLAFSRLVGGIAGWQRSPRWCRRLCRRNTSTISALDLRTYPLLNPHFDGENPIRLTPAPGIAGTTMH